MAKHSSKVSKAFMKSSPEGGAKSVSAKLGINSIYVVAKTAGQKIAIDSILKNQISFIYGMAGTGKSHLAIGMGIHALMQDKYTQLILTRPSVEAGEHLGYLPGNSDNKIAPYIYPLLDIANNQIGKEAVAKFLETGNIRVIPLAYMRGLTFKNSYVVADEMQNSTQRQMRMLLTRIGENCKVVITGDNHQSDLNRDNGLSDAITRLARLKDVGFAEMKAEDCVRSGIVAEIEKLYNS